jgi:hypothetical protein
MRAFQFVAILASTLFSGAAIYVNLAEHPARMECGTQLAVTVFGPSYRRAAVMQIILALTATIAGISAWFLGAPRLWFVGAVLIFAVIPFTLIVIMPTNRKLLDPGLDRNQPGSAAGRGCSDGQQTPAQTPRHSYDARSRPSQEALGASRNSW